HDSVPLLSSLSLSTDIVINKALYKLEEKYESLNDCGSKVTFLQKIEALAAEKNVVPKAPLRITPKGQPTSTKRNSLLSELQDKAATKKRNIKKPMPELMKSLQKSPQLLYHDQISTYMHKYIKEVINVDGDGNCGYRILAVCLERNKSEWSEMKKELREELNKREQFYQSLFLVNGDYAVIIREISWMNSPCTFEYWIRMPLIGDVI
ncbi:5373_t:CDS:1, partial [Ambispora gerdemannii]